jgi:hypothetical protein
MRVRVTRKLADLINGIDLSSRHVGDIIELPGRDAEILIAEGWAKLIQSNSRGHARRGARAEAADRPLRRRRKLRSKG